MRKFTLWIFIALGLAVLAAVLLKRPSRSGDEFTRLMTRGNGLLESGDATNAIATYLQVVKLGAESLDARLNLANAFLLAGDFHGVIEQCQQALNLNHNSAAAYYLSGCAQLRLNQAEPAVQMFQQAKQIDPTTTALNFQLGLAQARLGRNAEAIEEFETVLQFEPEHPSAHYQLSQLCLRENRAEAATREMEKHQQVLAKNPGRLSTAATFERCKYTQPQVAFVLEQPDRRGVSVRFVDATAAAFGQASQYHAPLGVLDYNHDGRNSLFVREGDKGFRVLSNQAGKFAPHGELLPAQAGAHYHRCLVGDLNNDRFEDVIVLGEQVSHAFRFATNGQAREVTAFSGLKNLQARDGLLADLDFTGKLDLLTVRPDGRGLGLFQNLGNFYFKDKTNSGLPSVPGGVAHLAVEDWNNEDVPGIFLTRPGQPPEFFPKQRAGDFVQTNSPPNWPTGNDIATGDLNNDLRADLIVTSEHSVEILLGGLNERLSLKAPGLQAKGILLLDFDNDGWLDVLACGNGVRIWRNLGKGGFADVTADLGLAKLGTVDEIVAADFDNDGDSDLIASTAGGLRFLRNDGGNANGQLKLRLAGNRSNASGLGVRVELAAGNWRTIRTRQQLPLEIGVGRHTKIDALKTRWFDTASTLVEVALPTTQLTLDELAMPTGSCPFLYAWDGRQFKFVTDILGASPLGLPVSKTRLIEADPEEFLALGDEAQFPPKDGKYEIRITEELREVLYLDTAKLVVVDHSAGTLVSATSKLRPGKPFPPHELWTLRPLAPLRNAVRSDGTEVTESLAHTDRQMVSPVRLREPQLRGLAEPFSVTLDFGELPPDRPLVLVLNGWLRFGGGMANIAASLDANLPYPFPTLEAELPNGNWQAVPVEVGAPAGKTKTILVDLERKLPPGARRLRLTTAFEIHWDSAGLCEKTATDTNHQVTLPADHTHLHWRGFSEYQPLPDFLPLTPDYNQVQLMPPWRRTPAGWCTRYGPVDELLRDRDDSMVLLNGGDEVALSFMADRLPPKPAGLDRSFFLYVVGWDKDADFHVAEGWRVEPLPFAGMDDQTYARQPRPAGLSEGGMKNSNTRWVGPMMLDRKQRQSR